MSFTLPPKAAGHDLPQVGRVDARRPTTSPSAWPPPPRGPGSAIRGNAPAKGTPTASVGLTNPFDRDATLYASVQRVSGTGTPRLDAFFLGAGQIQHPVPASSLAEPAGVPGVVSVGAVCTAQPTSSGPTAPRARPSTAGSGVTVAAPGLDQQRASSARRGLPGRLRRDVGGGTPRGRGPGAHPSGPAPRDAGGRPGRAVRPDPGRGRPGCAGPDTVYGYGVLELGPPDTLPSPNGTTTTTPTGGSTTTTHAAPTVVDRAHDVTSGVDAPRPLRARPTTTGPPGTTAPSHDHGRSARRAAVRGLRPGRVRRRRPRGTRGRSPARPCRVTATSSSRRSGPRSRPTCVRFSVDGRLVQVERQAGFDLGGGTASFSYPFDTFRLGDGPHVLEARLQFGDGHEEVVRAPFQVDNRGLSAPDRPFQLTVAGSPAGDGAQPLDGAVVSGPLYLGLAGSPPAPVEPGAALRGRRAVRLRRAGRRSWWARSTPPPSVRASTAARPSCT